MKANLFRVEIIYGNNAFVYILVWLNIVLFVCIHKL